MKEGPSEPIRAHADCHGKGGRYLPLCLALLLTVTAFIGSLWGIAVFDDYHSVFKNPAVKDFSNMFRFFYDQSLFSVYGSSHFRPLTLVSHTVTFRIFGDSLTSFHAGNLLFHLGAVAAVYWLIFALLRSRTGGSPCWPAAIGAMLFGVHPAAGQVVHYISSRSDSLAFIGLAAAMASHVFSLDPSLSPRRKVGLTIVTLLFVGIALCSKEIGILAAPLFVGVDLAIDPLGVTPLRKRISRLALPCFPVAAYLIFVLSIPVNLPKIQAAIASAPTGAATGYTQQGLRALWVYLELAVFPRNLAILRELPPSSHPVLSAWVAGALFAAGVALSAYLVVQGRNRLIGLALFLFSFPFTPYLFIKLNLIINENRMYLPLAGLALAVTLVWTGPLCRWARTQRSRRAIVGIGITMLTLALLRDWKLSYDWASEERLWRNAVAISPNSAEARGGLGTAYMKQKRWREAIEQLTKAAVLPAKQPAVIYDNLGIASYMLGDKATALHYFRHAYLADPNSIEVLNNLGSILHEMGEPVEALIYLDRAIQLSPAYCEPYLEALTIMRTLGAPGGAAARIRAIPRHCLSDPRIAEIKEWMKKHSPRSSS